MTRTILKALLLALLPLTLGACNMLKSLNETLLFHPQKLPADHKYSFIHDFDELSIEVEPGVKLNALYFKVPQPKGAVFYMHGNAGSLDSWGSVADEFLALDYDVLIYDYRGYGKSGGSIESEEQMYSDAKKMLGVIDQLYGSESIVLYGRSLGTGIAVDLAKGMAGDSLKMVILETPYTSMMSLAKTHYPIIPSGFVQYKFDTASKLSGVKVPIYLIHGTKDGIVPYSESLGLMKVRPGMKLFTISGGGHNNLSAFPGFALALKEILP